MTIHDKGLLERGRILYLKLTSRRVSHSQSGLYHCLLLPLWPITIHGRTSPSSHLLLSRHDRAWLSWLILRLSLVIHCLLSFSQKVMWQLSESNKTHQSSLEHQQLCTELILQSVPRRCGPSHLCRSPLSLGHQGEHIRTRCPTFLLFFLPTD